MEERKKKRGEGRSTMEERFQGPNFNPGWRRSPSATAYSLFVSNLPPDISKTELQVMFCRAGAVIDTFIPTERSSGKQRGFGFVRFKSEREAKLGLELVNGRSWRGRRILVDIARPRATESVAGFPNSSIHKLGHLHHQTPNDKLGLLRHQPPNAWNRPPSCLADSSAGWIIKDAHSHYIRVAPLLVESEMKSLCHSLIGFLKQGATVDDVARWLNIHWGKSAARLRLLEEDVVHIQLLSDEEVRQVLSCDVGSSSKPISKSNPFIALDRWMEVIGSPPITKWVRFYGVPLQAWNEGVFRLLGDFIGSTVEVDRLTSEKTNLVYGRVKIKTSRLCKLPMQIPLSVGELLISIKAEEDLLHPVAPDTDGASIVASSAVQIEDDALGFAGVQIEADESSSLAKGSLQTRAKGRKQARSGRSRASTQAEARTWPTTNLTSAGHGLMNGDSLCSFLRDLGRPSSSAPALVPFTHRKDSTSDISTSPSSPDTPSSSVIKLSNISIAPSSRDPPIFHQIKESSHSKDRNASDAHNRQEKEQNDVLRLLARSYVSDSEFSKSGSATHPSLPPSPRSVPATILSASRDSAISPSRQNSDEDLLHF